MTPPEQALATHEPLLASAEKLLPEFDEEYALTRRFLNLIPDDKLTWRPHQKSMELGRLAWHLAGLPEWAMAVLEKELLVLTTKDAEESSAGWIGKKRAEILAKFDNDLALARQALGTATEDDLSRRWKLEWGGKVVLDQPRYEVYRRMVMNHMVHHRAQLGVYLRMLDVPLPGCYGPSADEG